MSLCGENMAKKNNNEMESDKVFYYNVNAPRQLDGAKKWWGMEKKSGDD